MVEFTVDKWYDKDRKQRGIRHDVPIMKIQSYSLNDIFKKRLLLLIPFYIFSHEKSFPEYNSKELFRNYS